MQEAVSQTVTDHRQTGDRRQFGWRTIFFGFLRSRRQELRRTADGDPVFVDWHHPWLFFLAVGTMLLSCADAVLTLRLIDLGMVETNPVMLGLMVHGTWAFAAVKMAMTGIGVLMLVFMARARFLDRIRTGLFLTAMFAAYACLVCYEIVSLFSLL